MTSERKQAAGPARRVLLRHHRQVIARAQEVRSMRYILLLTITAALAGCGDVVAGNETGGTIESDDFSGSAAKSFPKAEEHCAKYGKRAKIMHSRPATSISVATMTFECV